MIKFKYIKWKNFLSTGDTWTEVNLVKSKSTLIVGENGAGKSTLLDALSLALYGRAFRKITKGQLVNTINGRDALVEVEFAVGKHNYMIRRGIKPTIFEVYQNGKMINQDAAIRDYQDLLTNQILKLNHKSFSQIVVLGSASFTPFMQLSSSNRREVIEDLLDLQVFSTMNILLKSKSQQHRDDTLENDYKINSSEDKIALQENHIKSLSDNNNERIESNDIKIAENTDKISSYNIEQKLIVESIDTLQEQIKDKTKIEEKISKLSKIEIKIEQNISNLKKEISFFDNHENCPTCHQDIDEEFKCAHVSLKQEKLNESNNGLTLLKDEANNTNKVINEMLDVIKQVDIKQREYSNLQSSINACQRLIEEFRNDNNTIIGKLKEDNTAEKTLKELKKESGSLRTEKNNLIDRKILLDSASKILRDSGIKSRIIKQYVPVINKLVNKYLAAMDFFVKFELDENFNEKIRSRYRDDFSYDSFSEGEKMRIDLALLFTWRAIAKIKNSISTNLLLMDEVFDSSLDNNGTEEFLKIINDLTADTNLFIISHKGDTLFDKFHNVIRFEKVKNFSRIAA
jgi:DNA repair exonuclease SbcCD ATPase subunit